MTLRGSANRNDWRIAHEFYRNYLLTLDIARDEELAAGLTRGSYHPAILYPN
jgi:hypothetical protein